MNCERCGKPAKTETRRQHAAEVANGEAVDPTQRAYKAGGAKVPLIECIEDHPHPNLKDNEGNPIIMKGDADDLREVCSNCSFISGWRKPLPAAEYSPTLQ